VDFWGFRPSGCHTAQSNAACRVGGAAGTRFVRRLEVFTLTSTILTLPEHLRLSLTWDQGKEMSQQRQFTIVTGVLVYFCDPHSPWQRGSNENTMDFAGNTVRRAQILPPTHRRTSSGPPHN
jgi:uncharacterized protein YndB with AHSA1/START domain